MQPSESMGRDNLDRGPTIGLLYADAFGAVNGASGLYNLLLFPTERKLG